MCGAIICLFLSLGARASAEAIQCSPTDNTSACHVSDQSVLLQNRLKISGKTCNPCEIRGQQPYGKLALNIFTPAASQVAKAVVLVFHGKGGTAKSMHYVCKDVVVPAGFVCASLDGKNNKLGGEYLEGAIRYLTDHDALYGVDSNNFFAYGYSLGGYSTTEFMKMQSNVGNKLKGVVSDNSAPPKHLKVAVKQKDSNGNYLRLPAYLMIHCDKDKTMEPGWTVDTSEKVLKKTNGKRSASEKIQWQSMRFSKATSCSHTSLIKDSKRAGNAMRSFIQNIMANDNPFTNIPKAVTDKNWKN